MSLTHLLPMSILVFASCSQEEPAEATAVVPPATERPVVDRPAPAKVSLKSGISGFEPLLRIGGRRAYGEGETNYPSGVAVDPTTGDVIVQDLYNNRIQRFTSDGTWLDTWSNSAALGLTVDARNGDIVSAVRYGDTIRKYDSGGNLLWEVGSTGSGEGQFDYPQDVAVDPVDGDVYVLDTYNYRVVILDEDGAYVSEFDNPSIKAFGIAIHPDGDWLAVANTASREIVKYDMDGTELARISGQGSQPGELRWPRNVAIDADGRIIVADTDNERLQIFDSDLAHLGFAVGLNNREMGEFHPRAVDVDPNTGDIYAAAAYSHRIDKLDSNGVLQGYMGWSERRSRMMNFPKGLAVSPWSQDLFVADWRDHRIKRYSKDGDWLNQFDLWIPIQTDHDGNPFPEGYEDDPTTSMWIIKEDQGFPSPIDVDGDGNVWVSRGSMHYDEDPRLQADHLIRCFTPHGEYVRSFGYDEFPRDAVMRGLAVDRQRDRVYVANSEENKVHKFDFDGNLMWTVDGSESGKNLKYPSGVDIDYDNRRVYVLDMSNDRVVVYDLDGNYQFAFGSGGTGDGQLNLADFAHLAIDPHGFVFIGDSGNNRVAVFDLDGNWVTSLGEYGLGGFGTYRVITAVEVADGVLYLADQSGYEVEMWRVQYED